MQLKEKQIEQKAKELKELAKIIRVILESRTDIKYIPNLDFPIAKEVLEHYQSKHFENNVIISKEEYEKLKNLSNLVPKLSLENLKLKEEQKEMQKAIAKDNSVNWLLKQDRKITEKRVSNETAEKIIAFIETLRVPEDGRHEWRDRHNDTISRIILKLKQNFINGVEIKG